MNIAIILHGQPRDYKKGYNNIMNFIKKQTDCKFDFFYHTWRINENEYYTTSKWRNIDQNTLLFKEEILSDLHELYNPISYEIDNQNTLTFDESLYMNTIAFNNSNSIYLGNISNTLFNIYSKTKARHLFDKYLKKMDNTVHYDFVIPLRFDIDNMPEVNLRELDIYKTHVPNILYPRYLLPDFCCITSQKIYLEWHNLYEMLPEFLNDTYVTETLSIRGETNIINMEQMITSKYLFHYKNLDNISYF